jgi:hypothetical protein
MSICYPYRACGQSSRCDSLAAIVTVHGLACDIRQGVTYYENIHKSPGKFDIVMARVFYAVN